MYASCAGVEVRRARFSEQNLSVAESAQNVKAKQKYSVKAYEKLVAILDLFTYVQNSLTLDQIAKRSGLSKTTTFRILRALEQHGFFRYNEMSQTYSLGIKLLELGGIVYGSLSLRKVAAPYLDALSHSLKATILFGMMEGDHLLYLDKRESESIIRSSSYIGLKRPPSFGVLGMVLVAYMNEPQRKRLLKLYPPTKLTEKTLTGTRDVLRRLDEIRTVGYYVERGEVIEGVLGIGVPIADFSGRVVAALGACLPDFQIKSDALKATVQELLNASRLISKGLGNV